MNNVVLNPDILMKQALHIIASFFKNGIVPLDYSSKFEAAVKESAGLQVVAYDGPAADEMLKWNLEKLMSFGIPEVIAKGVLMRWARQTASPIEDETAAQLEICAAHIFEKGNQASPSVARFIGALTKGKAFIQRDVSGLDVSASMDNLLAVVFRQTNFPIVSMKDGQVITITPLNAGSSEVIWLDPADPQSKLNSEGVGLEGRGWKKLPLAVVTLVFLGKHFTFELMRWSMREIFQDACKPNALELLSAKAPRAALLTARYLRFKIRPPFMCFTEEFENATKDLAQRRPLLPKFVEIQPESPAEFSGEGCEAMIIEYARAFMTDDDSAAAFFLKSFVEEYPFRVVGLNGEVDVELSLKRVREIQAGRKQHSRFEISTGSNGEPVLLEVVGMEEEIPKPCILHPHENGKLLQDSEIQKVPIVFISLIHLAFRTTNEINSTIFASDPFLGKSEFNETAISCPKAANLVAMYEQNGWAQPVVTPGLIPEP